MDVRCSRCGTEYEFDDALVSERGTTVKCTNCGHQFKVHPPTNYAVPERWLVRTGTGREIVYTSLRELQRGITQRQVGPEDMLARGDQPARALGSIAELEPFFNPGGRESRKPPRTLSGVAPPATVPISAPRPAKSPSSRPPAPRPSSAPPAGAKRTNTAPFGPPPLAPTPAPEKSPALAATLPSASSVIPTRTLVMDERLSAPVNVAPVVPADEDPESDDLPTQVRPYDIEPPTLPRNMRPSDPPRARPAAGSEPLPQFDLPTSAPDAAKEPLAPPDAALTPTPSAIRDSYHVADDDLPSRKSALPPPPRSRWILALIIVGAGVLLAATVGRNYLIRLAAPPTPSGSSTDSRVTALLDKGNQLLSEGDVEGAKEQFDKASGLGEKDPAVVTALARLETIRADLLWLRLRLLAPEDAQEITSTHKNVGRRVAKALEAVDRAVELAPNDLTVVRARVDALRLRGDVSKARGYVGPLSEKPNDPENAYVLAALDLADDKPAWSSVIDRLRTAAAAERDLGRARAALVYALVRSGDIGGASSELAKIEGHSHTHPLLADLKAFVERNRGAADGGVDAQADLVVDPNKLPMLDTSVAARDDEGSGLPGDFRSLLEQASSAVKSGNLDRAERLYNSVLAKQPSNTEALAGLGDVARLRKDPDTAEKMYDKVLKQNPSYLPALVARADQRWDSGDLNGAMTLYRRILEQAGAGSSYGQHAAARLAQGAKKPAAAPSTAKPAETKEPPPETPPAPSGTDQPHIDTSDLPGFNQ